MDPVSAVASALADAVALMHAAAITEPLRFAASLSDGNSIYAFRWSSDQRPPTLYCCEQSDHVVVASEPVDERRDCWQPIAANACVVVRQGRVEHHVLDVGLPLAA